MSSPSCCAFCGLPLPAPLWGGRSGAVTVAAEPAYCCFGCRFAASVAGTGGEEGAAAWALARLGVAVFLVMNVMVFTMALWTQEVYGPLAEQPLTPLVNLFRYLCMVLALPVLLLLGGPLLENAWASLRRGEPTTDVLMLVGVAAAYGYSVVSVVRDEGPIYFEVGCMVLLLVTLGRWLEARGKLQATRALDALQKLLPDRVGVVRDGTDMEVGREEIRQGDRVSVAAGERIPCDGAVVGQPAAVDEQVLTGESTPRVVEPGEPVHGGTLNVDSTLLLEAIPGAAAFARLVDLMRQARQAKGRYERLADRVTAWFLPAVMLLALGTAFFHGQEGGIERGILSGLAVLLIACPCALGLATPMAVWAALGRAAQHQVLFQTSEALERLAGVRAVLFDKTGTLTTGQSRVDQLVIAEGENRAEVLDTAAALGASSRHIHALAICQFAKENGHLLPACNLSENVLPFQQTRTLPGRGLEALPQPNQEAIYLGSVRLMQEKHQHLPESLATLVGGDQTVTCIGWGRRVRGEFVFEEELRAEALPAIAAIRGLGLEVEVLTGDHAGRGAALAQLLHVPVQAGLLPEDKVAAVMREQRRVGPVAMVGDGINDAPALAASDVGIALGCGADVSRASAGVCLLGNDLLRLPWALELARQTVRVVRQNLFWAFAYNVLGLGFACTGRLTPVLAALAMVISSLLVVANSLRLGWTNHHQEHQGHKEKNIEELEKDSSSDTDNTAHGQE